MHSTGESCETPRPTRSSHRAHGQATSLHTTVPAAGAWGRRPTLGLRRRSRKTPCHCRRWGDRACRRAWPNGERAVRVAAQTQTRLEMLARGVHEAPVGRERWRGLTQPSRRRRQRRRWQRHGRGLAEKCQSNLGHVGRRARAADAAASGRATQLTKRWRCTPREPCTSSRSDARARGTTRHQLNEAELH